ncbi:hypothetical protein C8J57DRAFT_1478583 [Mycena rebaudengoi]|nr:hypothetical protein C8J57DRAFT_1478583 [Mycena rebaudengoi]
MWMMFPFLLTLISWLFLPHLAFAGLLASSAWRKPAILSSSADRIKLASDALEESINHLTSAGQFAGRLYEQMAEFDLMTNQTRYRDILEEKLRLTLGAHAGFSDDMAYGHASIKAYAAYKTKTFLDFAVQSWTYNRQYTLSQSDISSGKTSVKAFPLSTVCDQATTVGGTFWSTVDRNNSDIVGLTTGSFLILSSLLAEATSDPMYLQAATESADFIQAHLINDAKIVSDTLATAKDRNCFHVDLRASYNSGLAIQGLAVLTSITNNASTRVLLNDILSAAVTFNGWQAYDGIVHDKGGARMVDGLRAAYTRNVAKPEFRDDIKAYLGVQYNAVLDLSTKSGSNIYSIDWLGPPATTFTAAGQTDGLSTLLAVIPLEPDPSSTGQSSGSPSQTGDNKSPPSKKAPVGAIAGGVIGGVAILAAVLLSLWVLRRRRRNTDTEGLSMPARSPPSPVMSGLIEPFLAPGSSQYSVTTPPETEGSITAPFLAPRSSQYTATTPPNTEAVGGLVYHPASDAANSQFSRRMNEKEPPPTYHEFARP